jgi:nucleotide-binding universal stress UspA family protein
MTSRILVTTDGSSRSDGAMRLARALARRAKTEVLVLSVVDPGRVYGLEHSLIAGATALAEPYEITRRRTAVARQIDRAVGAAWPVSIMIGDPGPTIAQYAAEKRASLVLLGGPLDRGSAREKMIELARLTAIPLLAVPAGIMDPPRSALVGVDFSPSSVGAARMATELLEPDGVLHLIHVALALPTWPTLSSAMREWERTYRVGAASRLSALGREILGSALRPLRVETRVIRGEPDSALLDAARRFEVEVLAVGTHGQGDAEAGFAGSATVPLFNQVGRSVLFYPASGRKTVCASALTDPRVAAATGVADPQLV